jgi:kumamolisin
MYRKFLTQGGFREQFGARPAVRRKVLSLRKQRGVRRVSLNPSQTFALAVMRPAAAKRLFCAGPRIPGRPCRPRGFRWAISGVSVGEIFPQGPAPTPPKSAAGASGTPEGCSGAIASKALTPNQLNTAYEVDGLRSRGLDGSGVAVNTLSSAVVGLGDFRTWAACFDQPAPQVTQFAMPGGVVETQDDPDETVLDVEALSAIAPRLERITPVFVPLDQNFSNSFLLFMLGSLDPSRQGGGLPDVLSISDGVCEYRFRRAEKFLANRLLAEASALGITALSASGDLGFRGCESGRQGTSFPASSRFVTGVGGTNLDLAGDNHILGQPVWSTYATEPREGVGSGGGPSAFWSRPGFQAGPGITPALEKGDPTRLVPDVAAMASFEPGIAVFQESSQGWGGGGGTSAATPLTAAMVALAIQQEREAGRPALGSINPLLYSLARGSAYATNFFDVTVGTSSQKPDSPRGMSPAGGAAQPGYDLATGLGSLRAAAFADAVAATPPAP